MEFMDKKYDSIDDVTNDIASINNKIKFSLIIEDIDTFNKNKKKRNMLKKISSNIACIIEYIQDMTEDYKQIYNQDYIIRENLFYNFILKKIFISFVGNNNLNYDLSNSIYSFLNFKYDF